MKPETKKAVKEFFFYAGAFAVGALIYNIASAPVMSLFNKGTSMITPSSESAPAPKV